MFVARLAVAMVLVSVLSAFAQPALKPVASFSFTVVDGTLMEVFDVLARTTGIEIQLDDDASAEAKSRKVDRVNFVKARLEDVLQFLTRQSGLTFEVVDEDTVRIRLKQ
jgi:hypothetical protein